MRLSNTTLILHYDIHYCNCCGFIFCFIIFIFYFFFKKHLWLGGGGDGGGGGGVSLKTERPSDHKPKQKDFDPAL